MQLRAKQEIVINIFLLLFSVCLVILTRNNPFYWDNIVQTSVPANWYFETDFKYFYVPDQMATGHPTFVGMYFAMLWKLFGRSLLVCHSGMLPFVFGLLYQIQRFLRNLKVNGNLSIFLIILFVIADATFLSQLSLITFDVIQLFFFFLCINFLLREKSFLFGLFYMVLILVSLRASVMAGGLLLFNLLYDKFHLKRNFRFNRYLKYLPGILALLLFLVMFRITKGWMIHNTVSNEWPDAGEFASFRRMIANAVVMIWQIIDFGRIGLFMVFLFIIFSSAINRRFKDGILSILFLLILSQYLVFFPVLVTSQISFGHRYFLPIIIPAIIFSVYWMLNYSKRKVLWLPVTFVLLIAGHFLIYPRGVSEGWDATTMHWNYLKVSESMHSFVKERGIDKSEIGTFFPNRASRYYTHLENDKNDKYSGAPFVSRYVMYSNAFNVPDDVLDSLFGQNSHWKPLKDFSHNRIHMTLYRKINSPSTLHEP